MPDLTAFLWFISISGVISIVFMHGGAAGWLVKSIANLIRPL